MQAVITAILLDPEARHGDDPANASATGGHLQEPILYMTGLLRAFWPSATALISHRTAARWARRRCYPAACSTFLRRAT